MKVLFVSNSADVKNKPFIKFKCPGYSDKDSNTVTRAIMRLVDRKSMEYAGVPISGLFFNANNRRWNLYDGAYFRGADGSVFYFIGADTENWKGFSVKIGRVPEEKAAKLSKESIKEGFVSPELSKRSKG